MNSGGESTHRRGRGRQTSNTIRPGQCGPGLALVGVGRVALAVRNLEQLRPFRQHV